MSHEVRQRPQFARKHKVKQGPQLLQVVLDRWPWQDDAMRCPELKERFFLRTGIILILRVQMMNYNKYFLNLLNLTCHVSSSCLPQSFLMLLNQAWLASPHHFLQLLTRIWINYCHENQLALYWCCIMGTMTLYVLMTNRFKLQPQTSSELVGIPGLMMRLSFHTCSGRFHSHKRLPHIFKNRAQFVHQEQTNQSYSECQPLTCL